MVTKAEIEGVKISPSRAQNEDSLSALKYFFETSPITAFSSFRDRQLNQQDTCPFCLRWIPSNASSIRKFVASILRSFAIRHAIYSH
jgi:hypothetical protein